MHVFQIVRLVTPKLTGVFLVVTGGLLFPSDAYGQIIPDNTLGAESSVLTPGAVIDLIEGGATRGSALFHSFTDFNVNTGQQVYFANPTGIENILSRVTGFSPSQMDGLLGVNGSANLFFLNPNGIIFGPDAQLDVEGSFVASTSDRFRFADGNEFRATDPNDAPLVTVNIPLGLQLGPDAPAALVSEADLETGRDLRLSAGSVTSTGLLSAPNGEVRVEGAAGDVQVRAVEAQSAVLSASENLVLTESRLLTQGDLSLLAEQTVQIRDSEVTPFLAAPGGDLLVQGEEAVDILALNHPQTPFQAGGDITLISDGVISADAHFTAGGSFSVLNLAGDIANLMSLYDPIMTVGGDFTVGDYTGPSMQVNAGGNISYGIVTIDAIDNAVDPNQPAFILDAGGNITGTGNVSTTVADAGLLVDFQAGGIITISNSTIDSSNATGLAGDISLIAEGDITLTNTTIDSNSDNSDGGFSVVRIQSNTGSVSLDQTAVRAENSGSSFAGDIFVDAANTISITNNSTLSSDGDFGRIFVGSSSSGETDPLPASVEIDNSILTATNEIVSGTERAGDISIRAADTVNIQNSSSLFTSTFGDERGGDITVTTASGLIALSNNSSLNAGTSGAGNGGDVFVRANSGGTISLNDSVIDASTTGSGNVGRVEVSAAGGNITLANSRIRAAIEAGATGGGNPVDIAADSIFLENGSRIEAVTFGSGNAGNINVEFIDEFRISGTNFIGLSSGLLASSERDNSGLGGNININTVNGTLGTLQIADGGFLSSRTLSTAAGGDIDVNVDTLELMTGGQLVTAATNSGNAGNITVRAANRVLITGTNPNYNPGDPNSTGGSGVLDEIESNEGNDAFGDSIDTAQAIDPALFSIELNSNIFESESTPHVSISGDGDNTFDYYSVSVASPGSQGIFDIDAGIDAPDSIDTSLFLFDEDGNLLAGADTSGFSFSFFNLFFPDPQDAGGARFEDPLVAFAFPDAGNYIIAVGQQGASLDPAFDPAVSPVQPLTGPFPQPGQSYTLQVALNDPALLPNQNFNPVEGPSSGLFATSGDVGTGGLIDVITPQLTVAAEGQISASTVSSEGQGIVIENVQTLDVSGGGSIQASTVTGQAGNVSINSLGAAADSVTVTNGFIGARATEAGGRAGNVDIQTQVLSLDNSAIRASNVDDPISRNITLRGLDTLMLESSAIEASSTATGVAGNIGINRGEAAAESVVVTNSSIGARATGAGGQAGNVDIQTQVLSIDSSAIEASNVDDMAGGSITLQGLDTLAVRNSSLGATTETGVAGNIGVNRGEAAAESVIVTDSFITARATGTGGQAGNVDIQTQNLNLNSAAIAASNIDASAGGSVIVQGLDTLTLQDARIEASTETGVAGNIGINRGEAPAETVTVADSFIVAQATGAGGQAGNVDIQTQVLSIDSSAIEASNVDDMAGGSITLQGLDTLTVRNSLIGATTETGVAGNIGINRGEAAAESVMVTGSSIEALATGAGGQAGNVDIQTQNLSLNSAAIAASNIDASTGGSVTVQGLDTLTLQDARIEAGTATGVAGNIGINREEEAAETVTVTNSFIVARATGAGGQAGNVDIQTQALSIDSSAIEASNVDDSTGSSSIALQGINALTVRDARIEASTETGVAGNIGINQGEEAADIITLTNSFVTARASEAGGQAGNVEIRTRGLAAQSSSIAATNINAPAGPGGSVTLSGLSSLAATASTFLASTESGVAGGVSINRDAAAAETVTLSSSSAIRAAATNGTAGNVTINANNFQVLDDSTVTVSSPSGQAGSLNVRANRVTLDRGFLSAVAGQGEGGADINLDLSQDPSLTNFVRLRNESLISANAQGDATGGNIAINADFIFGEYPTGPEGSDIIANAQLGNGGIITIDAPLGVFGLQFRPERTPLNDITANSQQGDAGIVAVNTLAVDPTSGLAELAFEFIDASDQTTNQCTPTSSGEASEVRIAGRGGLPPMPTAVLGATIPDTADWVTLDDNPREEMSDETAREEMSGLLEVDEDIAAVTTLNRQQTLCHRAYQAQ